MVADVYITHACQATDFSKGFVKTLDGHTTDLSPVMAVVLKVVALLALLKVGFQQYRLECPFCRDENRFEYPNITHAWNAEEVVYPPCNAATSAKVACNYSCVEIELQLSGSSKKHHYRGCWPNRSTNFRDDPSFNHARVVDYDAYGNQWNTRFCAATNCEEIFDLGRATKDYDSSGNFLALVALALIGSACSCACVAIGTLKRRKILVEPRHELISFVRHAEQDIEMPPISPPSMSNPVGNEEDTSPESAESAHLQIEPVDGHPQDMGATVQTGPEDKE